MVIQVALYALITTLATGLGALPLLWLRNKDNERWLGYGNALAAGAMIAASVLLLKEGEAIRPFGVTLGFLTGILFIWVVQKILNRHKNLSITSVKAVNARKMLLVVAVMTLHSFSEGVGIGVSFSEGLSFGLLITIAMAIHNIPEGLAISLVLVPRGVSVLKAAGWSIFSSIPQVITAIPAFLFVEQFQVVLAPGLGFAAGAMIWMCAHELIPEAGEKIGIGRAATLTLLAAAVMILLQRLLP